MGNAILESEKAIAKQQREDSIADLVTITKNRLGSLDDLNIKILDYKVVATDSDSTKGPKDIKLIWNSSEPFIIHQLLPQFPVTASVISTPTRNGVTVTVCLSLVSVENRGFVIDRGSPLYKFYVDLPGTDKNGRNTRAVARAMAVLANRLIVDYDLQESQEGE